MIPDIDIYRSAKILVDQHGDDAPIRAAQFADAMLDRGDMDGRAVWLRIMAAVEVLSKRRRPDPDCRRLVDSTTRATWTM